MCDARDEHLAERESVMAKVRQLRGVSWEWADPRHPSYRPGRQMGVIAQELQRVFPDLVREQPDGHLAVDYAGLLAPMIEALKEVDARLARAERALQLSSDEASESS